MSKQVDWGLYEYMLGLNKESSQKVTVDSAVDSLISDLTSSPSYQAGAIVNGNVQPLGATRNDVFKCKFTVLPGDTLYIGDLVSCLGEQWLVMESKTDEYGLTTAIGWLCNHLFKFQNHNSTIHECYGIIDDGSYSSHNKKIATTVSSYTAYLPMNSDTRPIHVDKRFAVDTILNASGDEVLEVYKVVWIDTKSQNIGIGSHVLKMELEKDVFNLEVDNLYLGLCDYIVPDDSQTEVVSSYENSCKITGKDSIRTGTTREFYAHVINNSDGKPIIPESTFVWQTEQPLPDGITIVTNNDICRISVALDESLIGEIITLNVVDTNGLYNPATKQVEVVPIG